MRGLTSWSLMSDYRRFPTERYRILRHRRPALRPGSRTPIVAFYRPGVVNRIVAGAERCKDAGHQTSVDPEPTMPLPSKARYVVIGTGIHGLSTAYHLAKQLEA